MAVIIYVLFYILFYNIAEPFAAISILHVTVVILFSFSSTLSKMTNQVLP